MSMLYMLKNIYILMQILKWHKNIYWCERCLSWNVKWKSYEVACKPGHRVVKTYFKMCIYNIKITYEWDKQQNNKLKF